MGRPVQGKTRTDRAINEVWNAYRRYWKLIVTLRRMKNNEFVFAVEAGCRNGHLIPRYFFRTRSPSTPRAQWAVLGDLVDDEGSAWDGHGSEKGEGDIPYPGY